MSREIKFRGLGILTGKWREGLLITNKLGSYIVIEENPHECILHGYLEIDEYERVNPKTVGQYTGLKDKNSVEIYEGMPCVIRGEEPLFNEQITTDYDWELTGVIKLVDFAYWLVQDEGTHISLAEEFDEIEVIENPELLEAN